MYTCGLAMSSCFPYLIIAGWFGNQSLLDVSESIAGILEYLSVLFSVVFLCLKVLYMSVCLYVCSTYLHARVHNPEIVPCVVIKKERRCQILHIFNAVLSDMLELIKLIKHIL